MSLNKIQFHETNEMFVNTMNQVVFLLVCSVSEEEEMEEEEQEEEQGLRVAYFRGPEGVCGGRGGSLL